MQDGFRKQLSFEAQLVEFIDDITRNNDSGHHTDCLIMDFSQASIKQVTVSLSTNLFNMESKEKQMHGQTAFFLTEHSAFS